MRKLVLLVLLFFLSVTTSVWAQTELSADKLGVAIPYPIYRVSPTKLDEPVNRIVLENLCSRLTALSAQGDPELEFASNIKSSNDSDRYEISLHQNAYFPSMRLVTADDVKQSFSFFNTLLRDYASARGSLSEASPSHRGRNLNQTLFSSMAQINEITVDQSAPTKGPRVIISLNAPSHDFLSFLSLLPIVDGQVSTSFAADYGFGTNVSFLGPYQIRTNRPGEGLVLERTPEFYRTGRPKVAIIDFRYFSDAQSALRALRVGAVDIIALPTSAQLSEIKKDPTLVSIASPLVNLERLTGPWQLEQNHWSDEDNPLDGLSTSTIIVRKSLHLDQAAKNRFDLSGTYLP